MTKRQNYLLFKGFKEYPHRPKVIFLFFMGKFFFCFICKVKKDYEQIKVIYIALPCHSPILMTSFSYPLTHVTSSMHMLPSTNDVNFLVHLRGGHRTNTFLTFLLPLPASKDGSKSVSQT